MGSPGVVKGTRKMGFHLPGSVLQYKMQFVNASSLNYCRCSDTWLPQSLLLWPLIMGCESEERYMSLSSWNFSELAVDWYLSIARNSIQEEETHLQK